MSAKDFAATARKVCPGINIIFLKKSELEPNTYLLIQAALYGDRKHNDIRKVYRLWSEAFKNGIVLTGL